MSFTRTVTGGLAVAVVVLVSAVVGCKRAESTDESEPVSSAIGAGGEIYVFKAANGMALAKVNGESVSVGDFRKRYRVEEAIYNHTGRKSKTDKQLQVAKTLFMRMRQQKILAEIVNQRLISQYLAAAGIAISEKEEKAFLKGCLAKLGFKKEGVKVAAQELGVDAGYLADQLMVPLRVEVARNHYNGAAFTVTEKEIDEGLARQDRYYERAVASNAVTYATCSNILKMVTVEGRDFKEIGLKYGQYEPEEAERWGRFEYKEFENKALADWAFKAPIGSVGGPFELDDGLSIVKILDRSEGTLEDSLATLMVADVTLARITFYLVVPEPEPRTREFVKDSLLTWKIDQAQKKLFDKLHAEMKLEYPYGTNFVFETERKGEKK